MGGVDAPVFVLLAAGLFGLIRLGLLVGAEALAAGGRRAGLRRLRRPQPAKRAPLPAEERARAAHLFRLGFEAGGGSVHGALRYVADLSGAPAPLRAAAGRALSGLRAGLAPSEALLRAAAPLGSDGERLFRLLAALWEAGPEAVAAALDLFAAQARRRAVLAAEARGALLPLKVIRWLLRAGLVVGLLLPVHPYFRAGWLEAGPLIVLYPLLGGGGLLADLLIGRFVRSLGEGLL